ncbi:hypothetical protein ElyMa_006120200 [Elysia marginata]|uniref:Uncharacterized protein n=1 Tax=Elysia marginata TaxID=1093978 RepID=A0AAV4GTV0_9GAST|nr:hypothetical protein ElyMa_006120200 [Elysia marginata]
MPPHVMQNKAIVPFVIDTKNQNLYDDRLCFFICMAAHQTGTRRCVEARARALFHQWTDTSVDGFEGVTLWELVELEDVFRVDIDVSEFRYDPPCPSPIDEALINTETYCIYFSCTVAISVIFKI